MAVSPEAITVARITTILKTILTAAQVIQGTKDFAATDEFLQNIVSTGAWAIIKPAEQVGMDKASRNNKFEITVLLYFGFANNANYDYAAIMDTVFSSVRTALKNPSLHTDCATPHDIRVKFPNIDTTLDPVVGEYEITLTYMGCLG